MGGSGGKAEYKYRNKNHQGRIHLRSHQRKKELKLISFETLENRRSNGSRARSLIRTPERGADEREKKTIEGTERTALEEAMATKDARDRGILNHFGILRSPPKVASSFRSPASIHVFKGVSSDWDRPYAYGAQPNYSKPPHAAEEIAGRVSGNVNCKSPHAAEEIAGRGSVVVNCKSPHAAEEIAGRVPVNANCKPPHAAEEIAGRLSVNVNSKSPHAAEEITGRVSVDVNCKSPHAAEEIVGRVRANANCKPSHAAEEIGGRVCGIGNSIFEDGTKTEWFFDESRASVLQQWAADRKAARPQVRDQDFLAKNAESGGVSVSQERQRLADFENELDQVFTQLPKYALAALTAGGDIHVFDTTPISILFEVLKERAAEKRWSAVRMHGALLALRQLFDFMQGRNEQMGVEGQSSGAVVTRFLQNFKEASQHKARKRKVDAVVERQERENE